MIRLYIAEKEVDIDRTTAIPLNFTYQDLDNPSHVRNSFSKTVSLPASDVNNAIFEQIWKMDQLSINFFPEKRVNFVLTNNGNVVESGYVKLESVSYRGQYPYRYNLTLFGGLGDFMYELGAKKLSELDMPGDWYNHKINAERVIDSWSNEHYKYALTYSGGYDNFSQDVVIKTPPLVASGFKGIVAGFGNFYAISSSITEGVYYSTDNGDNFTLLNGNYSFSNLAGYGNRIITGDRNRVLASTDGSTFSTVFTQTRFTATGSKYALDRFFAFGAYSGSYQTGGYTYSSNGTTGWASPVLIGSGTIGATAPIIDIAGASGSGSTNNYLLLTSNGQYARWTSDFSNHTTTNLPNNQVLSSCDSNGTYTVVVGWNGYIYYTLGGGLNFAQTQNGTTNLNRIRAFGNRFVIVGNNGKVLTGVSPLSLTDVSVNFGFDVDLVDVAYNNGRYIVVGNNAYAYTDDITSGNWTIKRGQEADANDRGEEEDEHQRNDFRSYYQRPCLRFKDIFNAICEQSSYTVELDPTFFNEDNPYYNDTWLLMDRLHPVNEDDLPLSHLSNIRSGDSVGFLNMLSDATQKEFLLSYTKMFGLLFRIDRLSKTVKIQTRRTFFSGSQELDWSNKIDYNKDTTIVPLTFDKRYYDVKWKEGGTHYEDRYESKYDKPFGYHRIDTNYEFNGDSVDVIEKMLFPNGVISQEYDLYFENRGGEYMDDKVLPAVFTKSNNTRDYVESSFTLLFYEGQKNTIQPYVISDDASESADLGIYSWQEVDTPTSVSEYPVFTRLSIEKGASLDIGKPNEYYYPVNDADYVEDYTIFSKFWKDYMDERYDASNTILNASFDLSPIDIANFDFRNFVTVGGTLWHVNKIIDYDPTKQRSTKCQLVRVKDVNAYTGKSTTVSFVINDAGSLPALPTLTINGVSTTAWEAVAGTLRYTANYPVGEELHWSIFLDEYWPLGDTYIVQSGGNTIVNTLFMTPGIYVTFFRIIGGRLFPKQTTITILGITVSTYIEEQDNILIRFPVGIIGSEYNWLAKNEDFQDVTGTVQVASPITYVDVQFQP